MTRETVPLLAEARRWVDRHGIARKTQERLAAGAREAGAALDLLPETLFGPASESFYMPVALSLEWELMDGAWLRQLALTQSFGHAYLAIQNGLIEGQLRPDPNTLVASALFTEYVDCLDGLTRLAFPYGPVDVLALHRRSFDAYWSAVARERRHRGRVSTFTSDEVETLGEKAAPLNIVLDLVAGAAGRSCRQLLRQAHRDLCTGLQLIDDLAAIEDDYASSRFTFPLATTLAHRFAVSSGLPSIKPPFQVIAQAIYASGVATTTCDLADRFLGAAEEAARSADALCLMQLTATWRQQVADCRETAASLQTASDALE